LIAHTLAQSGMFDDAIRIANGVEDGGSREECWFKIIAEKLNFKDYYLILLEKIVEVVIYDLSFMNVNSLRYSKKVWNYLLKQCIEYPEISYSICSLIAKTLS
jgi:hypothetical protein